MDSSVPTNTRQKNSPPHLNKPLHLSLSSQKHLFSNIHTRSQYHYI
nr:MAG TPA: hypothetical protein [Caudoviricetes sp.]